MREMILACILVILPVSGFASEVAVVKPLLLINGEENTDEQTKKLLSEITAGVENAGSKPIVGTRVSAGIAEVTGNSQDKCRQRSCLGELADLLEADEAIYVEVKIEGMDVRTTSVFLARGDDEIREYDSIGFQVLLAKVGSLVTKALRKSIEEQALNASEQATPLPPTPPTEPAPQKKEPKEEPKPAKRKPLSPTPFIVSAVITGAVGISWAITESVGYVRDKNGHQDQSTFRIADRVLLGCTAAGVITTAVLFFLTDFEGKSEEEDDGSAHNLSISPMLTEDSGFIMIRGRF
ncbi:MAG: hypothetical protein GY847_02430 [Proteobacteria bacterium]|nr:hypothetical protein [Pseudomonadota bacterium]